MICNISSHLVGCLFTLDTVFFDILFKKIFFMKSKLSFFFTFHIFASDVIAKKNYFKSKVTICISLSD